MALTRVKKVPTANLVQGSDFLTTSSNIAAARLPAGTVIQTHRFTTTTAVTMNTGAGNTTCMETTVPNCIAGSKFLCFAHCPNFRKTTGAGTSAWAAGRFLLNGSQGSSTQLGAFGYPETFGDQRYVVSHACLMDGVTAGNNTVAYQLSAQSSGSSWVFSYQSVQSELIIQEIAQ